jgi:hypothetical protein
LIAILDRAAGRNEDQVKELVAALRPRPAPTDLLRKLPDRRNDCSGSGAELAAAGTAQPAPAPAPAPPGALPPPAAAPPPPPAAPRPATTPAASLQPIAPERHLLRVTAGGEKGDHRRGRGRRGRHPGVTLERDLEERTVTVPPDLARALAGNRAARQAWDRLSYTHKKEHARALEDARKPETRTRRLVRTIALLTHPLG